jgi:signal transduction histidine kinase
MKPVRRIQKGKQNDRHHLYPVEEQARLDGEMFDGVTQSLFSLTLTLRAARQAGSASQASAEAERLLDSAEALAQSALSEMCALTFELRPQAREQTGLASALQTHVRSLQARSGLTVHLNVKGERRLPFELEEALYQAIRAALQEVSSHAQATSAWVELDLGGEKVYISMRDDSRDLDLSALSGSGMRSKIETLGGSVEIKRSDESGTEVLAWVPVR